MFSSRVPVSLTSNRIGRAVARARDAGIEIVDLTNSNPTTAGFCYPTGLLDSLGGPAGLEYRPEPLGLRGARRAVARHLQRYKLDVDAGRVVLTASTSDAYAALFKLLCDAGDEVLVPRPSYPLFEHLTRLEGIEARPYELEYHGRWEINLPHLRERLSPRTRAILLVNPNNPTGSFASADELDAVMALCRIADLVLIVDEVFGFYPMTGATRGPSVLDRASDVLTFSLGGLSKAVGLPQLKLGWIIAGGPRPLVQRALDRLELICDTYLSVAMPVQLAVGTILDRGAAVTAQISQRVRQNYAMLHALVEDHPASRLLSVDGGWYAPVQVPATRSEESLVLDLLERERVLVHPGYFFDFPREAFLLLSLLPEPDLFEDAVTRVLARVAGERRAVRR